VVRDFHLVAVVVHHRQLRHPDVVVEECLVRHSHPVAVVYRHLHP